MEFLRHGEIDYVIRYPESFSDKEKYPLVIYIHGAGGRGRDIERMTGHGFFVDSEPYLKEAVSVLPQCYADSWFNIFEQLQDYVEAMIALPFVDRDRVYLIGASMGGYGTWQLAMSRPELFAAIVPICGGGMYWNAVRLKHTPVWAFHGDSDTTVLPEESRKMVDKVNANGGDARLTIYENTAHNAWTPTFRDSDVWKWLLSKKNHYTAVRTEFNDTKTYG